MTFSIVIKQITVEVWFCGLQPKIHTSTVVWMWFCGLQPKIQLHKNYKWSNNVLKKELNSVDYYFSFYEALTQVWNSGLHCHVDYSTSHLKISVVPNLVKISTFFLKNFSKLRLNFVFSVKLWIIWQVIGVKLWLHS